LTTSARGGNVEGMAKALRVNMDEIVGTMERDEMDSMRPLLDLETGEVVWAGGDPDETGLPDEIGQALEDEPERYPEIPRFESRDGYALMTAFASTVEEEDIRDHLDLALRGKGAFGRFRDVVCGYPDLRAAWFERKRAVLVTSTSISSMACGSGSARNWACWCVTPTTSSSCVRRRRSARRPSEGSVSDCRRLPRRSHTGPEIAVVAFLLILLQQSQRPSAWASAGLTCCRSSRS
jgi:hypothetical protein